ncbi:KpsF/GutQ family sugar-phosphate isomerase [Mucilaginibacter sp. RS28]|uniref:KpsF/GutQ family sugar-phosphate isomerase n=1 Tax=Mucilaginibacter straminoryzae TaxID=2932774 RepID=A0A9X2B8V2_9SPHI|nr:KpsF/GutQ family sugar-phosphate isomerase [Mucilaginibacter straminoryzae]MCJ8209776.1 KpsF/GutQ family sugar-phosphate isomerase [Mucilaginibacter straminoryzae]
MMTETAKKVFDIEIDTLKHVAASLDDQFTRAVNAILAIKGKVIVSGVGKSGLIGRKIAATLASTGTPSFFLHPGEAFHGDLGMVEPHDAVILVSYSGETDEVLKIIPFLNWNKNLIISITGNSNSTLAKNSLYHLHVPVLKEACPLELAPTSSTTATLVMGDALAVALMEARDFTPSDFARFHPGGNLGRKLLLKVKDVMRRDKLPFIDPSASFTDLLLKMSEGRLGMVIVGSGEYIHGIVTDGDLRRALVKNNDVSSLKVPDMMTVNPVIVGEELLLDEAERIMVGRKIATVLVGSPETRTIQGVYQIYNR